MTLGSRGSAVALGLIVLAAAASPARATMPSRLGPLPVEIAQALRGGLFAPPAPRAMPEPGNAGSTRAQAAIAVWRVPVVLVSYSDSALITTAADFNGTLFDTTGSTATGSVYDFYQWASAGRLRVIPTVVATVTVPHTRHDYGADSHGVCRTCVGHNDAALVNDALQLCFRNVDWTRFNADHDSYVDMLWVVHAGRGGEGTLDLNDLWSVTSELATYWSNSYPFDVTQPGGPQLLVNRFSIVPELSLFAPRKLSEIGVYCHEFGHALGLPDLYDTVDPLQTNIGPGNWSLMSSGAYGGDGISPQYPSHPGAWCSVFLNWTTPVRPARDTVVTLTPVSRGGAVLDLSFEGEDRREHFLAECRRREGFDQRLPGEGAILYHVNDLVIGQRIQANQVISTLDPAMVLVEADGRADLVRGADHGSASDAFPGSLHRIMIGDDTAQPNTSTFLGAPTSTGLLDITSLSDAVRFTAQVRAPGWLLPTDPGGSGYAPLSGFGAGNSTVGDALGGIANVASELRAGRAQVILRTRVVNGWQPPFQVSQSTGNALDPTIAMLPGGDLAVAWSDNRSGRARIYYRARVRGQWIAEQPLADLPGESLAPAIGADARGAVQVAWLYIGGPRPQVLAERFTYLSPFGQPVPVSASSNSPGAPGLSVAPDGSAYVVFPDQATSPQSLRFARFDPRTGFGTVQPLTPPAGVTQQAGHQVVDGSGTLHVVWLVAGSGNNEIHYQRRPVSGAPAPADTTIEIEDGGVQGPRLASDGQGGIHLVYQHLVSGLNQVRYKRWRPGRGWDQRSTEISAFSAGTTQRTTVAPISPSMVTVLYTGYPDGLPHFMVRQRITDLPGLLDATPAPVVVAAARLVVGPNPLRRGQALELHWSGALHDPGALVEFFDIAGRRVATAALHRGDPNPGFDAGSAGSFTGALEPAGSAAWPSGVYFGRVRGSGQPAARLVFLR